MPSIKNILNENLNKTYYLPTIQRSFVWLQKKDDNKIERFFDSLMNEYPMGEIVIWPYDNINGNLTVYPFLDTYNENGNNEINCQNAANTNIRLVLDGQQRLTALNIALGKGIQAGNETKLFYINLLYQRTDDAENQTATDVDYKFEFLTDDDAKNIDENHLWFLVKNSIINTCTRSEDFARSQKDQIKEKLKSIFDDRAGDIWEDRVHPILTQMWNRFNAEFPIPIKELPGGTSLDKVLEIFVRLNDGGVKLEKADFLLSFIETAHSGFRDEMSKFLNGEKGINYRHVPLAEKDDMIKINKDFILKAALMLTDGLSIKYRIASFTQDNIDKIWNNWNNITKAITAALCLVDKYQFDKKTLTANNALLPIAYYLKKNPSADDNTLKDVILWLVKALLTGEFRGSGDTVLNRYRNEIDENTQVWFSSINVTLLQKTIKDLVDHAKYHGKETQLLLFLATDNHYWEKQQDHIYCQSRYRKRFGRNIDSIGNLELMSRTINSVEKSDMSAIEWYNKITEEDRKANLYPEGILPTDENFEEFIEARKKLIIKTVCEKMGISYTE